VGKWTESAEDRRRITLLGYAARSADWY